jgi:hypothetical protein
MNTYLNLEGKINILIFCTNIEQNSMFVLEF